MQVLLSPAKSLELEKVHIGVQETSPVFNDDAAKIANKLKKYSAKKIGQLMGLSENLAQLNYERYQQFSPDNVNATSRPALFMFDGDVYTGLDAFTMSADVVNKAQEQLNILSGLYGVLRPLDRIQPYRLEMGSSFAYTPAKSSLYKYWGDKIALELNKRCAKDELIVNLASNEYFKAVSKKALKNPLIDVEFLDFSNGKYKVVSFWAKKARGLMARYILENNVKSIDELKGFNSEAYYFAASNEKTGKLTFHRDHK